MAILSKLTSVASVTSAADTAKSAGVKKDNLFNINYFLAGLVGITVFYASVRWYEGAYGFAGLDTYSLQYRLYWLNMLYAQSIILLGVFVGLIFYLWKTRDRNLEALTPREEVRRLFHLLTWLFCYAYAIYWGLSFFTEQSGTWNQTMIRDSDFTPLNIIRFYLSYPIFVISGMGAFIYARTRLPVFAKGYSLPFLLATAGPLMLIPTVGLSEWGRSFWIEESLTGPMNYGYVFFGWFVLAIMGVVSQILKRYQELCGEAAKELVKRG